MAYQVKLDVVGLYFGTTMRFNDTQMRSVCDIMVAIRDRIQTPEAPRLFFRQDVAGSKIREIGVKHYVTPQNRQPDIVLNLDPGFYSIEDGFILTPAVVSGLQDPKSISGELVMTWQYYIHKAKFKKDDIVEVGDRVNADRKIIGFADKKGTNQIDFDCVISWRLIGIMASGSKPMLVSKRM
jgi:hypothetical protein